MWCSLIKLGCTIFRLTSNGGKSHPKYIKYTSKQINKYIVLYLVQQNTSLRKLSAEIQPQSLINVFNQAKCMYEIIHIVHISPNSPFKVVSSIFV